MALARTYVDGDTQGMYKRMFLALFDALFAITRIPIEFAHIHQGRGFQALVVDMCWKQTEGTLLKYNLATILTLF